MEGKAKNPLVFIIEEEPPILNFLTQEFSDQLEFRFFHHIFSAQAALDDGILPQLILLDLENNDFDNHEFCHHLKLSEKTMTIPVLICKNGHGAGENSIQGLKIGADGYLWKPFQKHELLESLLFWIGAGITLKNLNEKAVIDVEFLIQSDEKYLKQVNDMVSTLLRRGNFEKKFLNMLRYSILEMGKNAVEWGNKYNVNKIVKISCFLSRRVLKLKFSDQGTGFDFVNYLQEAYDPIDELEKREEDGLRRGGFGIFSIKNYMDLVTYNKLGNEVLLIKYLGGG